MNTTSGISVVAYIGGIINSSDIDKNNPVDYAWRDQVAIKLMAAGVECYTPYRGWVWSGAEGGQGIVLANERILAMADVLVADLDFGSVGTIREVQMALSLGIPVIARPSNPTRSPYARDDRIRWVTSPDDVMVAIRPLIKNKRRLAALPPESTELPPMFVALSDKAIAPRRAYPTSAGMDLFTSTNVVIGPEDFALVPTGVSIAVPDGYVGIIRGRSSAWFNRKLLVFEGTVDSEYRGELFVGVKNLMPVEHKVESGERLAQLLVMKVHMPRMEIVDTLQVTERGEKGFGSTGR